MAFVFNMLCHSNLMSVTFFQAAFGEFVSLVTQSREHEKYMLLDCDPADLFSQLMSFNPVARVMQQLKCSPNVFIEFMTADSPIQVGLAYRDFIRDMLNLVYNFHFIYYTLYFVSLQAGTNKDMKDAGIQKQKNGMQLLQDKWGHRTGTLQNKLVRNMVRAVNIEKLACCQTLYALTLRYFLL